MNAPLFAAVALGNQIERFGSYCGYAAIVGLAVLAMLYFAQAREVKRLREWAGRAPERDAELAQRVQAGAQRRVVSQPVAATSSPVLTPGGIPQTAAAQQADAARKAAAAAVLEKFQPPGAGAPAPPVVGPPGSLARPTPDAPGVLAPGSVPGVPASSGVPGAPGGAPGAPGATPAAGGPGATPGVPPGGLGPAPAAGGTDSAAGVPGATPGASVSGPSTTAGSSAFSAPTTTAPDPLGLGSSAPTAASAGAAAAAARRAGTASRVPTFANGSVGQDTHESDAARPAPLPDLADLPDLPRREPRPVTSSLRDDGDLGAGSRVGLIVAGCLAVLVIGVALVLALSGGGNKPTQDNSIGSSSPPAASKAKSVKVDRGATKVAVLNGTTQTGLARQVGNKLESSGFTLLSVGDNADQKLATTTIRYAAGKVAAAKVVAQIMDAPASAVLPIDANTTTAAGPDAQVVVVVGNDRSSTG